MNVREAPRLLGHRAPDFFHTVPDGNNRSAA
jgi:hypothetical protein